MRFLNLIREGKHKAILDFVANEPYLQSYEQTALIERGNPDEIMCFIAYHSFDFAPFKAFLKRGKLNEIRFYLACNRTIYDANLIINAGKGVLDEFIDYLLRHSAQYTEDELTDIQIRLILTDAHCVLRRYLCQTKLTAQARCFLQQRGNKLDNLVYNLCWSK